MIVTLPLMSELFDKFNKEYFNNELRHPVMKLSRSRTGFGFCGYKFLPGTVKRTHNSEGYRCWTGKVKPGSEYISMSIFYDQPLSEIENTMVHEMIHLYFDTVKGMPEEGHGIYFKSKCEEINRKSGMHLNVHVSDDAISKMKVNTKVVKKKTVKIFFWKDKEGYGYCTADPNKRCMNKVRDLTDRFWKDCTYIGCGISESEKWFGKHYTITPRKSGGCYFKNETEYKEILKGCLKYKAA